MYVFSLFLPAGSQHLRDIGPSTPFETAGSHCLQLQEPSVATAMAFRPSLGVNPTLAVGTSHGRLVVAQDGGEGLSIRMRAEVTTGVMTDLAWITTSDGQAGWRSCQGIVACGMGGGVVVDVEKKVVVGALPLSMRGRCVAVRPSEPSEFACVRVYVWVCVCLHGCVATGRNQYLQSGSDVVSFPACDFIVWTLLSFMCWLILIVAGIVFMGSNDDMLGIFDTRTPTVASSPKTARNFGRGMPEF